jgi:hypothetical protein
MLYTAAKADIRSYLSIGCYSVCQSDGPLVVNHPPPFVLFTKWHIGTVTETWSIDEGLRSIPITRFIQDVGHAGDHTCVHVK